MKKKKKKTDEKISEKKECKKGPSPPDGYGNEASKKKVVNI